MLCPFKRWWDEVKLICSIFVLSSHDNNKTNDFHITAVGGWERWPLQSPLKWSRTWICWSVSPGRPTAGLKPHVSQPSINRRAAPPTARLTLRLPSPSLPEAQTTIHSCTYCVSVALNHSCDLAHFKLRYIPPRFATPLRKTTTSVEDSGSFNLYFH